MIAISGLPVPSLVLLRSSDRLAPLEQAHLLAAHLPIVERYLVDGAVVSLRREHLRVRMLPIGRTRSS
jgi:hypothetical protein